MTTPAEKLLHMTLDNGWLVKDKLNTVSEPSDSGGNFSVQYLVENSDGYQAFLKAMDIRRALGSHNPLMEMTKLGSEFLYEKDINEHCGEKRLSHVVRCLDVGFIELEPSEADKGRVDYLIFEKADSGDIRQHIRFTAGDTAEWALRSLHEVAVGMQQLHSNEIAHLDLKPSNAVVFDGGGTKVSDLGSSLKRGVSVPHEAYNFSGDYTYAPPEVMYAYLPADWKVRRLGCDLYMLGNLMVFFFCGNSLTARLEAELAPEHQRASGIDYQIVLPYLQHAFASVLKDIESCFPDDLRADLIAMVSQLCEPDVYRRGHPVNIMAKHEPQHGLARYVGKLATLAKRAKVGVK